MGILRVLLAVMVIIHHTDIPMHGIAVDGVTAVEAFFIISGFYMALILRGKYNFPGGTRLFYEQRYLRLAPIYWVTIIATLGIGAAYSVIGHTPRGKWVSLVQLVPHLSPSSLVFFCFSNLSMLGLDYHCFAALSGHPLAFHFVREGYNAPVPASRLLLILPAWTLSIELLFYLVAPFLVWRSIKFQAGCIIADLLLRSLAMTYLKLPFEPWGQHFFPFELWAFLLGSVGYQLLPHYERLVRHPGFLRGIITTGLTALLFFYGRIPLPEAGRRWVFLSIIALLVPLLFAVSRRDKIDRAIGEISYPLYLLHMTVIYAFVPVLEKLKGFSNVGVVLFPLGAAALAYWAIERPIERWRAARYQRVASRHLKPKLEAEVGATTELGPDSQPVPVRE